MEVLKRNIQDYYSDGNDGRFEGLTCNFESFYGRQLIIKNIIIIVIIMIYYSYLIHTTEIAGVITPSPKRRPDPTIDKIMKLWKLGTIMLFNYTFFFNSSSLRFLSIPVYRVKIKKEKNKQ